LTECHRGEHPDMLDAAANRSGWATTRHPQMPRLGRSLTGSSEGLTAGRASRAERQILAACSSAPGLLDARPGDPSARAQAACCAWRTSMASARMIARRWSCGGAWVPGGSGYGCDFTCCAVPDGVRHEVSGKPGDPGAWFAVLL